LLSLLNPRSTMSAASGQPSSRFGGVRHRTPRYPVAVPMTITVRRSGMTDSIPGRSVDIGEGGVAAVLAGELQPGEWVGVEFRLPNASQALRTKAVVRHHNRLRCGLEFLGLSRDERYMIRHWAGTAQPQPAELEPRVINSLSAKTPAPVPGVGPRRLSVPDLDPSLPLRQLLGLALALFLLLAGVAAWQWHRGWQELESRTARKDVHARPPAARVPAEVMERLLIRKVEPLYPDADRRANLQGVVVLDAVIAADGTVIDIHPLSGAEGLTTAAMDAARWWRFRPYRIRGEPATVETTLTIEFRP
jgi:TonB family protein